MWEEESTGPYLYESEFRGLLERAPDILHEFEQMKQARAGVIPPPVRMPMFSSRAPDKIGISRAQPHPADTLLGATTTTAATATSSPGLATAKSPSGASP